MCVIALRTRRSAGRCAFRRDRQPLGSLAALRLDPRGPLGAGVSTTCIGGQPSVPARLRNAASGASVGVLLPKAMGIWVRAGSGTKSTATTSVSGQYALSSGRIRLRIYGCNRFTRARGR